MSGRKTGYTVLRAISCMAIVLMHTLNISEILYRDEISDFKQRAALTGVYCLMWAVPVFVMVTGALLLDPGKELRISKIFSKYIFRILMALALSVLVFSIFDDLMNGNGLHGSAFTGAVSKFLQGKSWSHLWYLYLLIGLYLLLPAYRAVAAHVSEREFVYLMAVLAVFLLLIPQLETEGFKSGFTIQISAVYTFYLFAGYGISSGKIKLPVSLGIILFITGLGLTVLFSFTGEKYLADYTDPHLGSYSFPTVALMAAGLFAVFCGMKDKKSKVWEFLDSNSFGIYLIHLMFLRLILRYMEFNPFKYGPAAFVLVALAAYAVSLLIIMLLRLIKPVRKVL